MSVEVGDSNYSVNRLVLIGNEMRRRGGSKSYAQAIEQIYPDASSDFKQAFAEDLAKERLLVAQLTKRQCRRLEQENPDKGEVIRAVSNKLELHLRPYNSSFTDRGQIR